MIAGAQHWTYALATDVKVSRNDCGAVLRTAISETAIAGADELRAIELLAGAGASETQIQSHLGDTQCAALLYRLDRLALLARNLNSRGRRLASCEPRRPPTRALPEGPPPGPFRLSRLALARAEEGTICLEAPGSWARMRFHDRDLLPLLQDLAAGFAHPEASAEGGHPAEAILAVLAMMSWCELLDKSDREGWSSHDLLFHAGTRRGYGRARLGKIEPESERADGPVPSETGKGQRVALERPNLARLLADDPPFALVSERRRSVRRHGSAALTSGQLSEFLFRTLRDREGWRPYPSGGALYSLEAYLAAHRCRGLARGLYAYNPAMHELSLVAEAGPGLDGLLVAAADAADVDEPPQVLLLLAARFARGQRAYGDLSYSLVLKEVGAVFQAAMMAAAAMGLGVCPLGCGDLVLFSDLIGESPYVATSVGELMLGSLEIAQ